MQRLLDFSFCTSFFQLSEESFSVSFADTFFNGLRCTVNEVFCFFQTEASQIFNDLNHVQFVGATVFQDNVESSFFFSSRTSSSRTGSNSYSSSCRLDTVLIFQDLCEFVYFFNSQANQLLSECF